MSCEKAASDWPRSRNKFAELPLRAAFVDVIVPAAGIDERDFQSDVGFVKLRHLLHRLAHATVRDTSAPFSGWKREGSALRSMSMASKRFRAGAAQRLIHGLRVQRLESAFDRRRLREHAELLHVRQRDGRSGTAQRERQIRSHGHGAKRRGVRLGQRLAARD